MPNLALFSFWPGMTPEQQEALIRGEQQIEAPATSDAVTSNAVAPEPGDAAAPVAAPAPPAPVKPRRRARTDRGTFQADDPATPEQNEAYEPEREN